MISYRKMTSEIMITLRICIEYSYKLTYRLVEANKHYEMALRDYLFLYRNL